jgi:anti-sigma-K factor RskA
MSTDRIEELLVADVTEGLDAQASEELAMLLEAKPGRTEGYAEVAAAITLASHGEVEPLPAGLRDALLESIPTATTSTAPQRDTRRNAWVWAALALSVAALVAAFLRPTPSVVSPGTPSLVFMPPAEPAPVPVRTARDRWLESHDDAQVLAWAAGPHTTGRRVRGDVAWSPADQGGYMRFRGLRPLDPEVAVYQLWIFDAKRDERYPVDGGVFSVESGLEEVVVPIDPALPVSDATLFAVTVEKPGGVVVSDRSRIAALAKP